MAGISYERIFSHPVLRTPALVSRLAIRGNLSHGFLPDQTNYACDGYIHHLQLQTGIRRKKTSEDPWPPILSPKGAFSLLAGSQVLPSTESVPPRVASGSRLSSARWLSLLYTILLFRRVKEGRWSFALTLFLFSLLPPSVSENLFCAVLLLGTSLLRQHWSCVLWWMM